MRLRIGLVLVVASLVAPLAASFAQTSYTWRDVLARVDGVFVGAGEVLWVEKYSKFSKTGYKIWKRPTTAPQGNQRRKDLLFFRQFTPSVGACFDPVTAAVWQEKRCDNTGSVDNLTVGNPGGYVGPIYGGSGCNGSSVATFGTDTYMFFTDCFGRELPPTVTPNNTDASVSRTMEVCPIFAGYASGRNALSCKSQDILIDDIWPVEAGSCTATLSVSMNTGNTGASSIRLFHTSDCGCIPDGYFKVTDGASGTTCEIRPGYGDPGALDVGDGGVPQNDTPGTKTGVPSTEGSDTLYPRPTGGTGGIAGGTAATSGGSGVVAAPGTTPVTIVGGSAGGGGGLTAGETTGAVADALNATPKDGEGNDVGQPVGPEFDTGLPTCSGGATEGCVPAESDWGTLITDFMAANPLVGLFSGSSLTASGSCSLSVSVFNATVDLDFCPLESHLSLVGTFLVMLAAVYALLVAFGVA